MSKQSLREEVEAVLEVLQNALNEANETVEAVFDAEDEGVIPGDCSFPIVWSVGEEPCDGEGGDVIDDPLVLRVHSSDEMFEPNTKYDISLQDAVDALIGMIDRDDEATLEVIAAVRDGLIELASQITEALDALEAEEE